jgi:hypothetical protein
MGSRVGREQLAGKAVGIARGAARAAGNFLAPAALRVDAQAVGQDMIDLFLIVPSLIVTAIITYKKNKIAMLLWSGAVFYLIYKIASPIFINIRINFLYELAPY